LRQYLQRDDSAETLSENGKVEARFDGNRLIGTWLDNIGQRGEFDLINTIAEPARSADKTLSWSEFKTFVLEKAALKEALVYRGQSDNKLRLRTTFHRRGRNDLERYLLQDIPVLRREINAVSNFYYRENDNEHLAGFLSLAQHHGYPTPLLDWTSSPYVAAFFAFADLHVERLAEADAARIFVFNRKDWSQPAAGYVFEPTPTISFNLFPAHNNPRLMPQQSVASYSNVDDMEGFIRHREQENQRKHLEIIDIPMTEKRTAIDELRLMGITAASMFPGLDGLCNFLKQRDFM
jgi:hypothetical protein